jgi:hypothetical protein
MRGVKLPTVSLAVEDVIGFSAPRSCGSGIATPPPRHYKRGRRACEKDEVVSDENARCEAVDYVRRQG